jgi:hypothetical protein
MYLLFYLNWLMLATFQIPPKGGEGDKAPGREESTQTDKGAATTWTKWFWWGK